MVAPVIAIGIYEFLAAGAAATGLGAFAVARRREIAEGLSDAGAAAVGLVADLSRTALPWIAATTGVRPQGLWRNPIIATGLDLDVDAIRPWSPPTVYDEDPRPIARPRPVSVPLEGIDGGRTGTPNPPTGPEDPFLHRLVERAKKVGAQIGNGARRVAQNPWVRRAGTAYKLYVYGSTAVAMAEISRRMMVNDPRQVHGPVLYDYVYEPVLGESAAMRTFLGGHQVMAAETSAGMVAVALATCLIKTPFAGRFLSREFVIKFVSQLPSFLPVHGYAAFGNLSFFEHQMTANNTSVQDVDVDRATRTAGFFGFTSIAYFPMTAWLINLPRFGRTGFREWWMRWGGQQVPGFRDWVLSNRGINWVSARLWRGVETLVGQRVAAIVAPHYVPRVRTWLAYAVFATVYRSGTQAVASLPVFEDSNMTESLKMTSARNLASVTLFDPYFYLGVRSNSLRSLFGNQVVFMGLIWGLNQFFSPFDGKDVAIKEADRSLQDAVPDGVSAVQDVVMRKPLTQRNVIVPPYVDLSVETWARLSEKYARDPELDPVLVSHLSTTMHAVFTSGTLDDRRVGMALGVLLTQIGHYKEGLPVVQRQWRDRLLQSLEQDGVRIHPRHAGRPLDARELDRVFGDINDGLYDESPLFQFPRP